MTSSRPRGARLVWLDAARGLAALGVVVWHWHHKQAKCRSSVDPGLTVLERRYLQRWNPVPSPAAVSQGAFDSRLAPSSYVDFPR